MFSACHYMTYDGHQYSWNSICNHSLTQQGTTYNPDLGIFTDFERCWGCGSCPSHTTFRNDPHTVVTITTGAMFDVSIRLSIHEEFLKAKKKKKL